MCKCICNYVKRRNRNKDSIKNKLLKNCRKKRPHTMITRNDQIESSTEDKTSNMNSYICTV